MYKYYCPRCDYKINDKTKYINHLKRKNICKPKLSNNDLEEEYKKYNISSLFFESKTFQNGFKKEFETCKINNDKINIKTSTFYDVENNDKIDLMNPNIPKMDSLEMDKKKEIKIINNGKLKDIKIKTNLDGKKKKRKIFCEFCEKCFSTQSNLNKHIIKCKEKIKIEEANDSMKVLVELLNKQIEEQRIYYEKKEKEQKKEMEKKEREFRIELDKRNKQIDELIKKSGINNSGTITTNIQNNIKLLAYKDTDLSKITDHDIIKCINHNNMCIPQLIKMIHLDPKKPENHNIYISNIKNGYIMLYDGKKWNTFNRDNTITDLIEDKQNIIEEKIEDWVTKGREYPELMKKFKRYLDKKENNEVLNKIKEEIKLMLYNNKNVISNAPISEIE